MSEPTLYPQDVRESDFPHQGTNADKLRFLLNYAVLAPSSHNTQPWLWRIEGDEVSLFADRSRALPALDPAGRELIISCGAALGHLRLAIHAFGYNDETSILPHPTQPDLLATVRLSGLREHGPDDELLFRNIPQRHTNRHLFEEVAVPDALLDALSREAEREGAWLHIVPKGITTEQVIDLVVRGDLIQGRDKAVRRDVADWIAPNNSDRKDGIPGRALGMSDLMSHVAPLALRVLDAGEAQADKDWMLAGSAPALVVLGTDDEGPAAWLACGQALSRVLLRARAAGVWASFFSQPIQVDELWVRLRRILDRGGFPQLVFRLGYADAVPPTPRRPVDEVTAHNASPHQSSD